MEARKYNSPKLQELLNEITPEEMEATKQQMEQTGVEWLENQIKNMVKNGGDLGDDYPALLKHIEHAKQIEKEQREIDFIQGYKKRAELSNLIFDKASELFARSLFNEILKTK